MRTALSVAAFAFGIGAFIILNAAGRQVCDEPHPRAPDETPGRTSHDSVTSR